MRKSIFGYGVVGRAMARRFGGFDIYDDAFGDDAAKNAASSDAEKNGAWAKTKNDDMKNDEAKNTFKNPSEFDPNKSILELISPGLSPSHPLVKKAKNPTSELDFFFDGLPKSVWISGSNGKSTTTQMCGVLLRDFGGEIGGNIGVSLADMSAVAPLWVLECSSFALHYTKRAYPEIYALLPITPDHLSWHGSLKAYEADKLSPLSRMGPQCVAFVPQKYASYPTHAKVVAYEDEEDLAKKMGLDIKKLKFKSPFLLDALLALSVAKTVLGEVNYALLNTFKPDAHKLEEFSNDLGVLWVDDSKATNMGASLKAIKRYADKELFLILGGDAKGQDLEGFFKQLKEYDLRLYLIGEASCEMARLCEKNALIFKTCKILKNAVNDIKKDLKFTGKEVVLLSPACASLDQFASYKERGKAFKLLAKEGK